MSPRRDWYAAYLASPWWLYVRDLKLRLAEYTCAKCGYRRFPYKQGMSKRLEVNHLSYQRLGAEREDDLEVLCEDCHKDYHELPHRDRPVAGAWALRSLVFPWMDRVERWAKDHEQVQRQRPAPVETV